MGCATSAPHDDNDAAAREFATVSGATPHGAPPRPHPADVETPARRRRRLRSERPSPNNFPSSHTTAAHLPGLRRLPAAAATAVYSDDRPSTDSRREPSVAGDSNTSRHQAADGPPSSGDLVSAESSSDAHQMPPALRPEHDGPRGSPNALEAAVRPRAPATTTTAVRPASEPADARSSSLNPLLMDSNLATLPNHTANTSTIDSDSQPRRTLLESSTRRSASRKPIDIGSRNPLSASLVHRQQQHVPRQGGATSDIRQTSSGRSFMLASGFFSPRSASQN